MDTKIAKSGDLDTWANCNATGICWIRWKTGFNVLYTCCVRGMYVLYRVLTMGYRLLTIFTYTYSYICTMGDSQWMWLRWSAIINKCTIHDACSSCQLILQQSIQWQYRYNVYWRPLHTCIILGQLCTCAKGTWGCSEHDASCCPRYIKLAF